MPLNTLPMRVWAISQGWSMVATLRMISDTANMPIMIGISVRPPASSALPKVKRGNPAGLSSPTEATSRPASSETMPFSGFASARNTALARPSTTSQKYSKDENLSAISASAWARTVAVTSEREALEHAPGQRDAQQLVEREVNDDRRQHGDRDDDAPGRSHQTRPKSHQQERGEMKPERIGGEDVKTQPAQHRGDGGQRPSAVRPPRKGHPGTAVPRACVNQPRAADAEADRDQPRKPCRPELLPRHLRKSLDMPEQHRREREQGYARDGVIDFQVTWRGRRLLGRHPDRCPTSP